MALAVVSPVRAVERSAAADVPASKATATGIKRPPTIDDYLSFSEIGNARISPDGRFVAVEVARPRSLNSAGFGTGFEMLGRLDIWLVDVASGKIRLLTNGERDRAGYWSPEWSPDSRRIALISNRGDGLARVGVFDVASGKVDWLTQQSVDGEANFGSASARKTDGRHAMKWLDNRTLLTVLRPPGDLDDDLMNDNLAKASYELTARSLQGEPSVTVWESRNPQVCGVGDTLVRIDVESHETTQIAAGAIRAISVSPDRHWAAAVVATRPRTLGEHTPQQYEFDFNAYHFDPDVETELRLINLADSSALAAVSGLTGVSFADARRHAVWSPDSQRLTVPFRDSAAADGVYVLDVTAPKVARLKARSPFDAEVLAQLSVLSSTSSVGDTRFGKRLDLGGIAKVNWADATGDVVRLEGNRLAVLTAGRLLVLDERGVVNASLATRGRLLWPRVGAQPTSQMVLEDGATIRQFDFSQRSPRFTESPMPAGDTKLLAAHPGSDLYVLKTEGVSGTGLWLARGRGSPRQVLSLNTNLAALQPVQRRTIAYAGPSGTTVYGSMWLPAGYVEGRRYPTVINPYPNEIFAKDEATHTPALRTFRGTHIYQELLAQAGYVVMSPTMPFPTAEEQFEPVAHLSRAVIAGLDAVISQGYADPKHVGLWGHSNGGYTVLATAVSTNRFAAVVAQSSFPDLIDSHELSMLPAGQLRECGPSLNRAQFAPYETHIGLPPLSLGASPLDALPRYIRNSPFFQMGSMQTPLLLVQGEVDARPMTAVDKVFSALYRRGVPVSLARYWGEGHNFQNSGNIRDAWARTLAWFDRYLKEGSASTANLEPR